MSTIRRIWSGLAAGLLLAATIPAATVQASSAGNYTWGELTGSGVHGWTDVAISADGTKLVASEYDGYIHTSSDKGATWTQATSAGARLWSGLSISDDGSTMTAVAGEGYIWRSTNGGADWTQVASPGLGVEFTDVAMSRDGTYQVASAYGAKVWRSSDSGATWAALNSSLSYNATSVATSSNGRYIMVGVDNSAIAFSDDSGSSWFNLPIGVHSWTDVAMSDNASIMIAVADDGHVARTNSSGSSWTTTAVGGGSQHWTGVEVSSGGSYAVASAANSGTSAVFSSQTSGTNWTTEDGLPDTSWNDVAITSDGSKAAAAGNSTSIWGTPAELSSGSGSTGGSDSNSGSGGSGVTPNNGDANGDGVQDSTQANVTSVNNPVSNGYTVLESDCGSHSFVSIAPEGDVKDPAYSYPAGLMDFTLNCGAPGKIATVKQYFYGVSNDGMVMRKYNTVNKSYGAIDGAKVERVTIGGQSVIKVTYKVADGGPIDQDGVSDGKIVDPSGLGLSEVGVPDTGFTPYANRSAAAFLGL